VNLLYDSWVSHRSLDMLATEQITRQPDQITRLGSEILRLQIEPTLPKADKGKFIAIDVDRAEFEVDTDDLTAVTRLQARYPSAVIYLGRVGSAFTYRTGLRR
jgi:hypothetical protein